jgi:CP family cyanate transporter-like MFS transporter
VQRIETFSLNFLSVGMRSNSTLFFGIILSLIDTLGTNILQISFLIASAPMIWGMTSFIIPGLMSRFTLYQIMLVGAWILALSSVLRLAGGLFVLFLFSITLNVGIGILNITIPGWIKQISPNSTDLLISRHYKIMLLASGVSIIMSVLILNTGTDWKWAFVPWLITNLIGATTFIFVSDRTTTKSVRQSKTLTNNLGARSRLATFILFFGSQGAASHAFGAWSPTLMIDYGFTALSSAIVCALLSILAAFFASKLLSKQLSQLALLKSFKIANALLLIGFLQLLSDRVQLFSLGMVLVFGSQSVIFLISLISIVRWSQDVSQVLEASLRVQGVGYVLSGFGPICVGLILENQESWQFVVYFMMMCTLVQVTTGWVTLNLRN